MLARHAKKDATSPRIMVELEAQQASIRQAISLTDKLLDISRVELASFSLERAEIDLVALVQAAIKDIEITSPSYSFELETPNTLILQGDPTRLNQVIRNLLDNAVKYSPYSTEPIQIKINVGTFGNKASPSDLEPVTSKNDETSRKETEVRFQIKDNGIGVKENDLAHLFQRQYRTQEAIEVGIKGSGFGLYISQQIIKAHGGVIWAEAVPSGGLEVNFTLPLKNDTSSKTDMVK